MEYGLQEAPGPFVPGTGEDLAGRALLSFMFVLRCGCRCGRLRRTEGVSGEGSVSALDEVQSAARTVEDGLDGSLAAAAEL